MIFLEITTAPEIYGQAVISRPPKRWAVVIGINAYPQEELELNYAVNDARAVAVRLQQMGFDVISLEDRQATKKSILEVLHHTLPQKVAPNDQVIIFYSGHGIFGKIGNSPHIGFLVPADVNLAPNNHKLTLDARNGIFLPDEPTFHSSHLISTNELRTAFSIIKAKHILFILDSCHSGFIDPAVYNYKLENQVAFFPATEQTTASLSQDRDKEKLSGESTKGILPTTGKQEIYPKTIQILTAGRSGEETTEDGGYGIFSKYLVRGLDGLARLDANNSGISIGELATYIQKGVIHDTQGKQHPMVNRIIGEDEMEFELPMIRVISNTTTTTQVVSTWQQTDAYKGSSDTNSYKEPSRILVDRYENLYVLDTKRHRLFKFDDDGRSLPEFNDRIILESPWKPMAMALAPDDNLWVFYSQYKKNKLKKSAKGQIIVYQQDGTRAPLQWYRGISPEYVEAQAVALPLPISACWSKQMRIPFPTEVLMAIDPGDNLILLDPTTSTFTKCDRNGRLLYQSDSYRNKSLNQSHKILMEPAGFAVDSLGYIYVANTKRHGIQRFFDQVWAPLWWRNTNIARSDPYFFNQPHGVTIDANLSVYIADTHNHRIEKYKNNGGTRLFSLGKKGKKPGEFKQPKDVAVNHQQTVMYVADTGNKRIQKFMLHGGGEE